MSYKIADLTGPGTSTPGLGVYGTDLAIPFQRPDGTIGYVCGDSFSEIHLKGNWMSPVIFWANPDAPAKIVSAHGGQQARQIMDYRHGENGETTRLPTDVIVLDGKYYVHFMVIGTGGLADCRWTGIAVSDDNSATWRVSQARWKGDHYYGNSQMNTWCLGPDGWVYCMKSKGLSRDGNVFLYRVLPADILKPSQYKGWGWDPSDAQWKWGRDPSPILPDGTAVGEMSLRYIEGMFVLSYFDVKGYCITVKYLKEVTHNWMEAPSTRAITGFQLQQLYGGYIMPGSTLANLQLVASEWNTVYNEPYRASLWGGINLIAYQPIKALQDWFRNTFQRK